MKEHLPVRNIVGAMEKRLAVALKAAGYQVLNTVQWRHDVPDREWEAIRESFAKDFPKLDRDE